MYIGAVVIGVLVSITVAVGIVAGAVSSTCQQPTTYAWRHTNYHPTAVSNVHYEEVDHYVEDVSDDLDLLADQEETPENVLHYETSVPSQEMESGINDLLKALSPISPEESNSNGALVFEETDSNTGIESSHDLQEIFHLEDEIFIQKNTFEYGEVPSPLGSEEYQQILRSYGPTVVAQITTTPAKGASSQMGDVMIGRLDQSAVGTVLMYGDHFVVLKGQIHDQFMGQPVLVQGQFASPEEFYVTSMTDPTMVGLSSVPFYDEMPVAAVC